MANEISTSMMTKSPSPVSGNSQFAKLETASAPKIDGQNLPQAGNDLPQESAASSVSDVQLRGAVGQINDYVQSVQRDLSFSMDEGSGHTIIRVIDTESGEVVRQIPAEEVLAIATYIQDAREASPGSGTAPRGLLFSKFT